MPPWMIPLMHSYSSDMAGVVLMRSVKGGSNLRTSRGSRGVRVANYGPVSENLHMKHSTTYKLDQLDGHPVVTTIHK